MIDILYFIDIVKIKDEIMKNTNNKEGEGLQVVCDYLNAYNQNDRYTVPLLEAVFKIDAVIARGLLGFCLEKHMYPDAQESLQEIYSFYESKQELGLEKFFRSLEIAFQEISHHIKEKDEFLQIERIRELFPD